MTRAKTTWLASLALAAASGGTAVAQAPVTDDTNDQPANPTQSTDDSTTVDTTTTTTHEPVTTDPYGTTTTTTVVTPAPTYDSTTVVAADVPHDDEYASERLGIAITAGAGGGGFVNDSLRNATDPGATWGVRLTFGTNTPLALEAAYIGSAQRINALGLDDNAYLVGNGVQGALRLNATMNLPVQPFAFAGLAWRRYDLANTVTSTADVNSVDNVVELPLGIGIAAKASGLIFDVRGEYRPAFDEDLLPELDDNGVDSASSPMDRWGVNANIGYEF